LKKNKINKQENKKREGLRACKPLYAPSAQDKTINQVFYIEKEKRNKQEKKRAGVRNCNPCPPPSA